MPARDDPLGDGKTCHRSGAGTAADGSGWRDQRSDISRAASRMSSPLMSGQSAGRDQARRDGVEIRYHSIIYELIDEIKVSDVRLLSPDAGRIYRLREILGSTSPDRQSGCVMSPKVIKRGCNVRLLRDNVVIHEGALKTLSALRTRSRKCVKVRNAAWALKTTVIFRSAIRLNALKFRKSPEPSTDPGKGRYYHGQAAQGQRIRR